MGHSLHFHSLDSPLGCHPDIRTHTHGVNPHHTTHTHTHIHTDNRNPKALTASGTTDHHRTLQTPGHRDYYGTVARHVTDAYVPPTPIPLKGSRIRLTKLPRMGQAGVGTPPTRCPHPRLCNPPTAASSTSALPHPAPRIVLPRCPSSRALAGVARTSCVLPPPTCPSTVSTTTSHTPAVCQCRQQSTEGPSHYSRRRWMHREGCSDRVHRLCTNLLRRRCTYRRHTSMQSHSTILPDTRIPAGNCPSMPLS